MYPNTIVWVILAQKNSMLHFIYLFPSLGALHSASTRKLYEKKLQKLLDQPPAEPEAPTNVTALPKAESNQNGNTNSDQYSDKEDGELWSFVMKHTTWINMSLA